jgi:hypothetical protein
MLIVHLNQNFTTDTNFALIEETMDLSRIL